MGKKNVLREIKGFGGTTVAKKGQQVKPKQQVQTPKPKSQFIEPRLNLEQWEAWQCRWDNSPANWHQVWEGSFEECFEVVENNVNCQIDQLLNRDGSLDAILHKYENDEKTLNRIMDNLYNPKIQQIKTECQQKGGYKGDTWSVALNSQSTKFRPLEAKGIFSRSDSWAGFEQIGKNASSSKNWQCIADGSLSACIEAMGFFINIDIEYATEGQLTDDMDIGDFFRYKMRLRSELIEEIKRVCQIKGYYSGCGWEIQSQISQEQCWWLTRHGSLDNYPLSR